MDNVKITEFTKFILTSLMAVGAVVFSASISQGAPATTTLIAPVELVSTITITSPVAVDFGEIIPPTATGVTEAYTVNSDGTTESQAGGTGEFVPGTASAGRVRVTGPAGTTVDLSSDANPGGIACEKLDAATGDVTLSAIRFASFGPDLLVRTAGMNGSPQTIFMGGDVSVPNGATGSHECTYIVDVIFTP